MMKKFLAIALSFMMTVVMFSSLAGAIEVGTERVTIGANLDEAQIEQIYADFELERGSVTELTVTNQEERQYLEGLVPERKIGSVALSCVYIKTVEEGSGLDVSTKKINWCTPQMYINALTTAGITDATVKVSAPFDVSGTAALTGIYKAYEDITGEKLSELAKSVGAEELVKTGELADLIGSEQATQIITELKKILDQTQNMTDDEVKEEIRNIAKAYNVTLSEEMISSILSLCRQLEKLDVNQIKERILSLADAVNKMSDASKGISSFFKAVGDFFSSIGSFFARLFGGANKS